MEFKDRKPQYNYYVVGKDGKVHTFDCAPQAASCLRHEYPEKFGPNGSIIHIDGSHINLFANRERHALLKYGDALEGLVRREEKFYVRCTGCSQKIYSGEGYYHVKGTTNVYCSGECAVKHLLDVHNGILENEYPKF